MARTPGNGISLSPLRGFANCDETHLCAGYAHRYAERFEEFQKNGQAKAGQIWRMLQAF